MSNTEQKKTKFQRAKSKNIEGAEQGKKKNKVLSTIINVVLVIAIVLAILATYVSFVSTSGSGVPSILGLRIFSIQTDSMYDTLMPGDLIVDTAVKDPEKLQKDEISEARWCTPEEALQLIRKNTTAEFFLTNAVRELKKKI